MLKIIYWEKGEFFRDGAATEEGRRCSKAKSSDWEGCKRVRG